MDIITAQIIKYNWKTRNRYEHDIKTDLAYLCLPASAYEGLI